jgi:hypothetical protein
MARRLWRLAEAFAHFDVISGVYCILPDDYYLFPEYATAGIAEMSMLSWAGDETRGIADVRD